MVDKLNVQYELDNAGKVFDYLREHGFSTEPFGPGAVIIRECKDISRLGVAEETGTDRDTGSKYGQGGRIMPQLGLKPEDITYAQPIGGEMWADMLNVIPGYFYLVYDPEKITPVMHEGKPLEGNSWKPREGHTFLDALILIIIAEAKIKGQAGEDLQNPCSDCFPFKWGEAFVL